MLALMFNEPGAVVISRLLSIVLFIGIDCTVVSLTCVIVRVSSGQCDLYPLADITGLTFTVLFFGVLYGRSFASGVFRVLQLTLMLASSTDCKEIECR